jgi:hypothetical protein
MITLTKEEDEFKKYYERLKRELHYTYWHFVIYKELDKARGEYKNELMQAPVFFSFSEHSHAVEAVMRVNRICEDNPDSVNIFRLLDYAEANPAIFSEEFYKRRKTALGVPINGEILGRPRINREFINQQREQYSLMQKTNLKKMRNKVLAHIDKDDVKYNIYQYEKYFIEPDELESLINEVDNTLSILGLAFDGSFYNKELPQITGEMKNLMETIRCGIQQSK